MLSDLARPKAYLNPTPWSQPAQPVILIDTNPSGDLLTDAQGSPVWPIRDDSEWRAVSRLCQLRSIELRGTTGYPGRASRTWGTVCGIGASAVQEVARLYAHLTRREYRAVELADEDDLSSNTIVVTSFEQLTSELLYKLYSNRKAHSAPGLVCASSVEQLRRQALVRSIFAHHPEIVKSAPWRAVYPTEQIGGHRRGNIQVFGGESSLDDVREAVTTWSGLLALSTHSDGVDAMLGPSLAMCGINFKDGDAPRDREPSCLANGFCHRFNVPLSAVSGLDRTVVPASISAGVFLFDTCFGTFAADAPINVERGLGRHLAENLEIGALVTTWELTLLDPDKLQGLFADLQSEMTLGHAVARFNRSDVARRNATRLALFGDPRIALQRPSRMLTGSRSDTGTAVSYEGAKSPALALRNELTFSRSYLEQGTRALSAQLVASRGSLAERVKRHLDVADRALRLVLEFERNRSKEAGSSSDDHSADSESMRRALIEDAFVRRPLDDWKRFAAKADWSHCRCAACGAASWMALLCPQLPGVSRRRVVLCPTCGVPEDMPEHVRLNLKFDRATGTCALSGTTPQQDWSGALIMRTRIEAQDRLWDWPTGPDGKPCGSMSLPEELPAGPVKLAVIIVHDGWIAWTAQDIHGGSSSISHD